MAPEIGRVRNETILGQAFAEGVAGTLNDHAGPRALYHYLDYP